MEQTWSIHIVGGNNILNQLLEMAVRRELSVECVVHAAIPSELFAGSNLSGRSLLLLVDDSDLRARFALFRLLRERMAGGPQIIAALFNVDTGITDTSQLMRSGVSALFFRSDAVAEMLKGIGALMKGESLIPRELRSAGPAKRAHSTAEEGELTARELEILALVTTGATNEAIGSELGISPHTVKTHLYNIFRKIGVDSRFGAALWLIQNLRIPPPHPERGNHMPMAAGQ